MKGLTIRASRELEGWSGGVVGGGGGGGGGQSIS